MEIALADVCSIPGCECGGKLTRGYCNRHYARWLRHGDPLAGRRKPRVYVSPNKSGPRRRRCKVDGCEGEAVRRHQFCAAHTEERKRKIGPALAFLYGLVGHEGDECVTWPFHRMDRGYGRVNFMDKTMGAHRAMCILVHGMPPAGMQAGHSCGNGRHACVNPKHLSWQTRHENTVERDERLRVQPTKRRMRHHPDTIATALLSFAS